jgi:hypothetical protein
MELVTSHTGLLDSLVDGVQRVNTGPKVCLGQQTMSV